MDKEKFLKHHIVHASTVYIVGRFYHKIIFIWQLYFSKQPVLHCLILKLYVTSWNFLIVEWFYILSCNRLELSCLKTNLEFFMLLIKSCMVIVPTKGVGVKSIFCPSWTFSLDASSQLTSKDECCTFVWIRILHLHFQVYFARQLKHNSTLPKTLELRQDFSLNFYNSVLNFTIMWFHIM